MSVRLLLCEADILALAFADCVLAAVCCCPEVLQVAGFQMLGQQHHTRHWLLGLQNSNQAEAWSH